MVLVLYGVRCRLRYSAYYEIHKRVCKILSVCSSTIYAMFNIQSPPFKRSPWLRRCVLAASSERGVAIIDLLSNRRSATFNESLSTVSPCRSKAISREWLMNQLFMSSAEATATALWIHDVLLFAHLPVFPWKRYLKKVWEMWPNVMQWKEDRETEQRGFVDVVKHLKPNLFYKRQQ